MIDLSPFYWFNVVPPWWRSLPHEAMIRVAIIVARDHCPRRNWIAGLRLFRKMSVKPLPTKLRPPGVDEHGMLHARSKKSHTMIFLDSLFSLDSLPISNFIEVVSNGNYHIRSSSQGGS